MFTDSHPYAEDLWKLTFGKNPTRVFQTPSKEWAVQISPDGRWMAYNSNETGQAEIYMQSFPPSGDAVRVSKTGGIWPRWRGDGKELFLLDVVSRQMMVVDVRLEPTFQAGMPRPLFDATMMRWSSGPRTGNFDVSADGQRFLVVRMVPDTGTRPLTLVQNWTARLKK